MTRQYIPVIKETDMATKELPALTADPVDLQHFMHAKESRQAKRADLLAWFDATAELRCSPPLFEGDEPGARAALLAWADVRKLKVEEKELDVIGCKYNRVTVVETQAHHHIDVFWSAK